MNLARYGNTNEKPPAGGRRSGQPAAEGVIDSLLLSNPICIACFYSNIFPFYSGWLSPCTRFLGSYSRLFRSSAHWFSAAPHHSADFSTAAFYSTDSERFGHANNPSPYQRVLISVKYHSQHIFTRQPPTPNIHYCMTSRCPIPATYPRVPFYWCFVLYPCHFPETISIGAHHCSLDDCSLTQEILPGFGCIVYTKTSLWWCGFFNIRKVVWSKTSFVAFVI